MILYHFCPELFEEDKAALKKRKEKDNETD